MSAEIPVPVSPLVGRDRELPVIVDLLRTSRLLTLTGAGGSGKTRLAVEVAARRQAAGDDAPWVELAPLADPALLAPYLVAALGLEEGGRAALDVVTGLLRRRPTLLVLDNCEHLVDAVAEVADHLLRTVPSLRILATSREALGVAGERAWLVPGLALPRDDATAATILDAEAGRLFVERAQAAHAAFAVTDRNAPAIAQICRRLDGLPLAIELAAARVRALTPEQVAARLDDAFRLLATGSRAALPRHRTLREAIDWSHALLTDAERILLARLSVWAGGFSLEGAEAVCGGDDVPPQDVLDLVAALVDKSLVAMREAGVTARYGLLETIRQYAAERLAARGEVDEIGARHARFVAALVREAEPHLTTAARPEWTARLAEELDNVRSALAWSAANDVALHLDLVGHLTWFWYSAGLWSEGRRWADAAVLRARDAAPGVRARVAFASGALATLQGQPAWSAPLLLAAIGDADAAADGHIGAYLRAYYGMALVQKADAAALPHLEDAAARFRAAGDLYGLRLAVQLIATLHAARGELDAAIAAGSEAVDVARTFGMARELGIALQVLAIPLLQRGDLADASARLVESLEAFTRDPHTLFTLRNLELLGIAHIRRGEMSSGVRLLGVADGARATIGAALFDIDRARLAPHVAAARGALGDDAYDAAFAAGRLVPLMDAVTEVIGAAGSRVPGERAVAGAAAAAPAAGLDVRMLGPVEIRRDGALVTAGQWRYSRPRELLLYLLAHPAGRTREQIGLAFWPDASAAQVKNNFHVALHNVRKALGGAEWVVFSGDRYRVNDASGVRVDALEFERLAQEALRTRDVGQLAAAADLHRGDLLAEEAVGDWHLELRDRLRLLYARVLRALGAAHDAAGEREAACDAWRRLVRIEELDEEAHRHLLAALAATGARDEAAQVYEALVRRLRTDLEAEPSEETRTAYRRAMGG